MHSSHTRLSDLLHTPKLRMDFAAVREQWLQSLSNTCSKGSNLFLLSGMVIVTYINRSIERWETSSENLHVHKDIFQRFFSFTLTFSVLIVYTTLWSISLHWWKTNNHSAPPRRSSVWHCWSSLNNFVWISAAETVDKTPWNSFLKLCSWGAWSPAWPCHARSA